MAIKYGVNADYRLVDNPATKVPANAASGKLRVCFDEYEISADLAAADVIYMGWLPKGAKLLDWKIAFDDLDASGGTIDMGLEYEDSSLSGDGADILLADVDVTSAGIVSADDQAKIDAFGLELSGAANVILTIDGDTDVSSGTIKCYVVYSME